MNAVGTIFCLVMCVLVFAAPRKWLAIPVILSICYMTMGQQLNLIGIHVFAYRLVLIFALVRILLMRELSLDWRNRVDQKVIILCLCMIVTGIVAGHLKGSLGLAANVFGFYVVYRSIVASMDDAKRVFLLLGLLVIPLALLVLRERLTGINAFLSLGGVVTEIREDKFRAQGPFGHAILAGTAGALITLPLIGLYRENTRSAIPGIIAGCAIILASQSSGPIFTVAFGCVGFSIYRYRKSIRGILLGLAGMLCCLEMVMKDHVWYILGWFDLVGGSTGWWRAELITQAFNHINEWWFVGTEYTRHWMAHGVSWSENHTDITNQYISMGVDGGLPLMITFIYVLVSIAICAYRLCMMYESDRERSYFCWALWSMLVSQMATFLSVGYFDQVMTFLSLNFAAIGSLWQFRKAIDLGEKSKVTGSIFADQGVFARESIAQK
jgi:hypothetical protein